MLQAALLAMQAAGMITDYFATQNQVKLNKLGGQLDQAGINMNIALARANSADATTQAMQNLRQTIGSQIAVQAARGNASFGGTTLSLLNESVGNFNTDERIRRMNLLARESELKAQGLMSGLHTKSIESSLRSGFIKRTLENIPTNPEVYSPFGSSFGSDAGKRLNSLTGRIGVAPNGSNGGSYGMTPV